MTTRQKLIYVLAAGSRGTLRPHVPSAAQIRRGAYPRAMALPATHTATLLRTVVLLLALLCGLGTTGAMAFHTRAGVHFIAPQPSALASR